jgi:hypothetical protein
VTQVYSLGNKNDLEMLSEPIAKKDMMRKWSLGIECYYNNTYFFISNEKDRDIEFAVKTKNKSYTMELAQRIFGNGVSVPSSHQDYTAVRVHSLLLRPRHPP